MSNNVEQNAAKLVAGIMMTHYVCGVEHRKEFFPLDETIDGIQPTQVTESVNWIGVNMTELFDNSNPVNVSFRENVLLQLRQMLELPMN